MTRTHTSKLAELRSKTDRQLYTLVARRLDRCGNMRAREEARRFLPYLSRADRRRIEQRLDELEAQPALRAACC